MSLCYQQNIISERKSTHTFKGNECFALEIRIIIIYKLSFIQMAEVVPEKSRGLKFAEQQLLRHGWEHGTILWSLCATIHPLQCVWGADFLSSPLCPQVKDWGDLRTAYQKPSRSKWNVTKEGWVTFWFHAAFALILMLVLCGKMFVDSHVALLYQVGHKEGDQFTFHWWDHVFNKASSSLQVESDQVSLTLTWLNTQSNTLSITCAQHNYV